MKAWTKFSQMMLFLGGLCDHSFTSRLPSYLVLMFSLLCQAFMSLGFYPGFSHSLSLESTLSSFITPMILQITP